MGMLGKVRPWYHGCIKGWFESELSVKSQQGADMKFRPSVSAGERRRYMWTGGGVNDHGGCAVTPSSQVEKRLMSMFWVPQFWELYHNIFIIQIFLKVDIKLFQGNLTCRPRFSLYKVITVLSFND